MMNMRLLSNEKGEYDKYMSFDCVETADVRRNLSTADCSLANLLFSRTIEMSAFNIEDLLVIEISSLASSSPSLESLMPMN
jgi:hypothetical protein